MILHAAGTAVGIGTGWFVGPTTIATAGHCLYPRGLSLDEVTVVPARSEEMEPFGRRTVTKEAFDAHEAWKSRREPSRDVGVIRLEAPFDGVDSWFRAAALGDDILRGYLVNIAGFPAEVQVPMRRKTGGDELWLHSNAIVGLTPDTLRYAVDTSGGQSGGPVWLYEPGGNEPIVVAVHAYGKPPRLPGMPEPSANSGTRIDAEILALFRRWGAS
jgi:glutamyl endopeptidase